MKKNDSRIPGLDILRTQGRRISSLHFGHDDDGEWDGAMQQQQCQRRKEERIQATMNYEMISHSRNWVIDLVHAGGQSIVSDFPFA